VVDDTGKTHTWTLVGPTEADMGAGRLSAESPVGSALRDGKVGAEIVVETPRGNRTFTISKLTA
jgi:transcription elongation GreA/GreB family factor